MLKRTSILKGARSISEFARSVVCSESANKDGAHDSEEQTILLTALSHTISSLDRSIQKLIETLESGNK